MKIRPLLFAIIFLLALPPSTFAQKKVAVPSWKPGYTAFYLVHLKTERNIKTKSALSFPATPNEAKTNFSGVLQVEIVSTKNATPGGDISLRTHFVEFRGNSGQDATSAAQENVVDCALQRDGQIVRIAGLEQLAPEQQDAWREWAAHFSAAFLLEIQGRKQGEKWDTEEPETSPAPIAQLLWQKKSQYVHNEPCAPVKLSPTGEPQRGAKSDSCAVILTTAALLQKSSQQDATPQDYKLRGLHTRGTAKGTNETILYISRITGQLVRATQEAQQQMDVQIALANGTNQVHYTVDASAYSSVELVTELTVNPQPRR